MREILDESTERLEKEPGKPMPGLPVDFSPEYYAMSVDSIRDSNGLRATATTTVVVPLMFAIPAIEVILNELQARAGTSTTALDLPTLRGALEEIVGAPVQVQVHTYKRHDAWQLRVSATSNAELYPVFEGVLYVANADETRCELTASGMMVDAATRSSLERFVRGMAIRIAVLARWARFI